MIRTSYVARKGHGAIAIAHKLPPIAPITDLLDTFFKTSFASNVPQNVTSGGINPQQNLLASFVASFCAPLS